MQRPVLEDFSAGPNRYCGGSRFGLQDVILMVEKKKAHGLKKEERKMEWHVVAAIALATPIILLPVVFVGYLTVGGIYAAVKEARKAGKKAEAAA